MILSECSTLMGDALARWELTTANFLFGTLSAQWPDGEVAGRGGFGGSPVGVSVRMQAQEGLSPESLIGGDGGQRQRGVRRYRRRLQESPEEDGRGSAETKLRIVFDATVWFWSDLPAESLTVLVSDYMRGAFDHPAKRVAYVAELRGTNNPAFGGVVSVEVEVVTEENDGGGADGGGGEGSGGGGSAGGGLVPRASARSVGDRDGVLPAIGAFIAGFFAVLLPSFLVFAYRRKRRRAGRGVSVHSGSGGGVGTGGAAPPPVLNQLSAGPLEGTDAEGAAAPYSLSQILKIQL